jgi:hypothetical protein
MLQEDLYMREVTSIVLMALLLGVAGCDGGGGGGPVLLEGIGSGGVEPPPGTPGSNSSLDMTVSPKEQTTAAGERISTTVTVKVPGSSGHQINIDVACPDVFVCPPRRTIWMSGTKEVEVVVDVTQQASAGSYSVKVTGSPAQGAAGGPFSGDSVSFDVHVVEASNESVSLVRSVIDPEPIERESWELASLEGIPLPKPLALEDITNDGVTGDVNADGYEDRVAWETVEAERRLVLHVGHAEPDQQLSRILQVRVATADQIDGLLLLWRMGYPYASLTTSRELYVNEDGRLADTPLPLEWEQDIPVRLAGGDLNRDGYDDVLYFPAIDANWFAVALSTGDGGFSMPVKFLEPCGIRAVVVADINMDGNADIVIKGKSCLTLWAGG